MSPRRVETPVNPAVLRWARESADVTRRRAADLVGKTPEIIEEWEAGISHPTVGVLRALASLYKRPLSVFLLPEPPKEPPAPADFRLPGEGRRLSRLSRVALRSAVRQQALAAHLFEALGTEVRLPVGGRSIPENPAVVGSSERERLGVSLEVQFSWPGQREALRSWRQSVENLGVLVMQLTTPWDEVRGFSLSTLSPPVIAINSGDYVRARIFTLFHEYGHLLLGTGGICIPEGTLRLSTEARVAETFCNDFAGSLLVPEEALRMAEGIEALTSGVVPADRLFNPLVSRFHVSQQVIWQRLFRLGLVPEEIYREKWTDWYNPPPPRPRATGGPTAPELCVLRNGSKFVSVVMEGVDRGAITRADALDHLGIRQRHWDEVALLAGD